MKTNWTNLPVSEFLKLTVADVLALLGVVIPTEEQPQEPPKAEEPPVELPPVVEEPEEPAPVEPPVKEEPPKENTPQPTPIEPVPDVPPVVTPLPDENAPPKEPPVKEEPPQEEPEQPSEPTPVEPPIKLPPVVAQKVIVPVTFENTGTGVQYGAPVTFGQVFKEGDVVPGKVVSLLDYKGNNVDLQMDVKALHKDGSVRHAVLSAILPELVQEVSYDIVQISEEYQPSPASFFFETDSHVSIKLNGVYYGVSADTLLNSAAQKSEAWLNGEIVKEIELVSPLIADDGTPHPHLTARFNIRAYTGDESARVDVVVENCWAYEPDPQNFMYDVVVTVGGEVVFAKEGFTHYHHSRYRTVAWTGLPSNVHVKLDSKYLIATRALPNYDTSLIIPEKEIASWDSNWKKAGKGPMNVGLSFKGMATTGGRPDIGILPEWSVAYLLSMDKRLKAATDGTADCAGSWSMHYRDKNTDKPVSLMDYPYMTILGRSTDTKNPNRIDPVTKKKGVYEAFPALVKGMKETPYSHDSSHQPGFSYLSYLTTGDRFYLEEHQFWAMYNIFETNPGYRKNIKGLVMPGQVRGQAWSMRTLAQAAYITPENDKLKQDFYQVLLSNLEWYNGEYSYNPLANKLGIFTHKSAIVYKDTTDEVGSNTAMAPWQDDFVTAVAGYIIDLFPDLQAARDFFNYKAKFIVGRFTDPEFNWIVACNYTLTVRATPESSPYETFGEVYRDTVGYAVAALPFDKVAEALGRKPNDMGGYPTSTEGFCANANPAVSYVATYGGEAGKRAYEQFMKRDPKPNYANGAQFAILPRSM